MAPKRVRLIGLAVTVTAGMLATAAGQNGNDGGNPSEAASCQSGTCQTGTCQTGECQTGTCQSGQCQTAGVARVGTPPPSGRYNIFRHGVRGRHGIHPHDYTHYDFVPPAPGAYSHAPQRYHYPYLHAPLYPTPRQGVPLQVGATMITNQALAPHEMLYPHEYHAFYPPFYYAVKGHWMVTPLGVWSWDEWQLLGTKVEVEYRPRIGLLSGFFPRGSH